MVQLPKSINEIHHINKTKKNSMIVSIDRLDKIQYPLMIKRTLNKIGTDEIHLNIKPYVTNLS